VSFEKRATMVKSAPYPRGILKRVIKAHSGMNVSKNVDIHVYLDYILFIQELTKEASIKARERGAINREISAADFKTAAAITLQKFKG